MKHLFQKPVYATAKNPLQISSTRLIFFFSLPLLGFQSTSPRPFVVPLPSPHIFNSHYALIVCYVFLCSREDLSALADILSGSRHPAEAAGAARFTIYSRLRRKKEKKKKPPNNVYPPPELFSFISQQSTLQKTSKWSRGRLKCETEPGVKGGPQIQLFSYTFARKWVFYFIYFFTLDFLFVFSLFFFFFRLVHGPKPS